MAGLRFEKRRSEWLLGRWTAKNLLKMSFRNKPILALDAYQVENEAGGKPYLIGPDGLRVEGCLSISHREKKAVCALTVEPGAQLGVDMEKVETRDPIFLEDYLGQSEGKLALACEGLRRDLLVTLAWSAKEAAFKALGTGLRMDTRKIEITGGVEYLAVGGDVPSGWQKLILGGPGLQGSAQAFWQMRGEFVITLVILGNSPLCLEEV